MSSDDKISYQVISLHFLSVSQTPNKKSKVKVNDFFKKLVDFKEPEIMIDIKD